VTMLKCDAKLVNELLRFAESFELEGRGRRTPDLLRRAARRLTELSERKRFFGPDVKEEGR
jgi:hypothetical protein